MKIELNSPCKIVSRKLKQYTRHYGIPAEACLILPRKNYGDQLLCNVVWKNAAGVTELQEGLMFAASNLENVDAIRDFDLHTLWENHKAPALPLS